VGNPIPLWSLCCFGLAMFYLRFGTSSVVRAENHIPGRVVTLPVGAPAISRLAS